MRIAIAVFIDVPDGGAIAHRVLMMAKGLVDLGHTVHVIVPFKFASGPLTGEINGVTLHWGAHIHPEASRSLGAKLRKPWLLMKSTRQVLRQGLDWLILYDMGGYGLPLLGLARRYGCLVAQDNCDIFYLSYSKSSLRLLLSSFLKNLGYWLVNPRLDLNIAISRHIEDFLQRTAPRVPRIIVRPPVDLEKFQYRREAAQAFRQKFGLDGETVIAFFGSVWAVKGLEVLFQAARKLLDQGKTFKILTTGRPGKYPYVLKLINELGLTDRVVLTGYLPGAEVAGAMSAADILVEPKIDNDENRAAFPQKLVEYLAMGKPIVASAIGDLTQFLGDGDNALLCPAGDAEALAEALARLMEDEGLRQKLSTRARATAEQYFDCIKIARDVEAALVQVKTAKSAQGE